MERIENAVFKDVEEAKGKFKTTVTYVIELTASTSSSTTCVWTTKLRYSELLELNELLAKSVGTDPQLPTFPGKKSKKEDRKACLEVWLSAVVHKHGALDVVQTALHAPQQPETSGAAEPEEGQGPTAETQPEHEKEEKQQVLFPNQRGWMFKEPGFWTGKRVGKAPPKNTKKWNRRWFVLDGARLNYYSTQDESEQPKGTVDVRTCTTAGKAARYTDSEANFELQVASLDLTYWLRCESPESYELWSDALNNALPKDMPTGGAPVPRTENKEKEKDEPGRMQTPESGQPEAEPETSGAAEPEEGQEPTAETQPEYEKEENVSPEQRERVLTQRQENKEKDEPGRMPEPAKLFFIGVPEIDAVFLKCRAIAAAATRHNNSIVEKLHAFRDSVGIVDGDIAPLTARCFGAIREKLEKLDIQTQHVTDPRGVRLAFTPAGGEAPAALKPAVEAAQGLLDEARRVSTALAKNKEAAISCIEEATDMYEDAMAELDAAGLSATQAAELLPVLDQNFASIVPPAKECLDAAAKAHSFVEKCFDGTKAQGALLPPRPGWSATVVNTDDVHYYPTSWWVEHKFNPQSQRARSLQAGPRVKHFYRSVIESGPKSLRVASFYGDGSVQGTTEQVRPTRASIVYNNLLLGSQRPTRPTGPCVGLVNRLQQSIEDAMPKSSVECWLQIKGHDLLVFEDERCESLLCRAWLGGAGVSDTDAEEAATEATERAKQALIKAFLPGAAEMQMAKSLHFLVTASKEDKEIKRQNDLAEKEQKQEHFGRKSKFAKLASVASRAVLNVDLTDLVGNADAPGASAVERKEGEEEEEVTFFFVKLASIAPQGWTTDRLTITFEDLRTREEWFHCLRAKGQQPLAMMEPSPCVLSRSNTPLAEVVQLQNDEQDGWGEAWAEMRDHRLAVWDHKGGQVVCQMDLRGCTVKQIKPRLFTKGAVVHVLSLTLQRPSSFGHTGYMVELASAHSMRTWMDAWGVYGRSGEAGEERPNRRVAPEISEDMVKYYPLKLWTRHGRHSGDDDVPLTLIPRGMRPIGLPSIDGFFESAHTLLMDIDGCNTGIIKAIEEFKSSVRHVSGMKREDSCLASCLRVVQLHMKRKTGLRLRSCLTFNIRIAKGANIKCEVKFELPSTGDSVLEELLEALKQLVTTVQELLVSKLANARRDVVKLIKSSYNILADAPLEFKRAQWDMLTVTSRMFALKSNVQALLEGKTVITRTIKIITNIRRLCLSSHQSPSLARTGGTMSMQDLREFNKFVSDDGYVDEAGAKRLLVELGATSTDKATASLFRTYATVEYDEEDKPQIGIRCNSNFSIILNAVKVDAAIAASTTLTNDTVGEIKEKDVRCILATLGHGKDDKKVGKLFQAYSADSKVLTVQQFKSLEKKFGGNAGTEGDSKVVSGKVRVCTRDNTLFAPIMVLPLEDDGDADEHGHEDGQGKVPRVLQLSRYKKYFIQVEDRTLYLMTKQADKKHAEQCDLKKCVVSNPLSIETQIKLSCQGHGHVFKLELANPSSKQQKTCFFVSTGSWESMITMMDCFEANARIDGDGEDTRLEEKIMRMMKIATTGFAIVKTLANVGTSLAAGNVGGAISAAGTGATNIGEAMSAAPDLVESLPADQSTSDSDDEAEGKPSKAIDSAEIQQAFTEIKELLHEIHSTLLSQVAAETRFEMLEHKVE